MGDFLEYLEDLVSDWNGIFRNLLSMDEWCRILIAQSKTSQVNPYANTRLPFTLHLADKMAKALIREQFLQIIPVMGSRLVDQEW